MGEYIEFGKRVRSVRAIRDWTPPVTIVVTWTLENQTNEGIEDQREDYIPEWSQLHTKSITERVQRGFGGVVNGSKDIWDNLKKPVSAKSVNG